MGVAYRENGGCCTRCAGPFGDNMTAYLVRETIVAQIFGTGDAAFAATDYKLTPVCDACVTPKEAANTTKASNCAVCGQRMMTAPFPPRSVCSSRCYQRQLRARKRASARATCSTCGLGFVPKRKDARFCSDACRQRAYRGRTSDSTPRPATS
jgi:hypothetical protein